MRWRILIFLGGADDVSLSLLHPPGCIRVTNDVEKPPEQRQAVPTPEPETSGVWRKGVGERAWVVIDGPDSVSHHVCHRLRILLVIQKIDSNPGRPGDRNTVKLDPLTRAERSLVEPNVGSARLPPVREREIVPLRRQVAEAIQCRGGTVGYDPLLRRPLPSRYLRGELKPRRPKVKVIWRRRPHQAVYAMSYPLHHPVGGQPLQGSRRHSRQLSLATGQEPPLILGER
jgi:hypothetical protein